MNSLERTYPATPDELWELWTTPAGIESWWSPDGFTVRVDKLDLREGGELVYTMAASAPEMIEFMQNAGMPLATVSRKTFTEVDVTRRLAYASLVNFVPGVDPYEFLTVVTFEPRNGETHVVMEVEPMHDDEWTGRLLAGRENELANLAEVVAAR